jgi:DNA polymerase-3 subunit epsilon
MPKSGAHAMLSLLSSARRPLKSVRAVDAPMSARAILKKRGYRWDPGDGERAKSWWRLVIDSDAEVSWLEEYVFKRAARIPVVDVPATKRFSARIWTT